VRIEGHHGPTREVTVGADARVETFRELVKQVSGKLTGSVGKVSEGGSVTADVRLPDGRHQRVYLALDEDTIRYSTQCASWLSDVQSPNLFKTLLSKNYHLKHGFFALNPEGGLELVDTQLLETADPEELYVSIVNLATVGDFMERELSKDRARDVF
jgi:hypothetical protein